MTVTTQNPRKTVLHADLVNPIAVDIQVLAPSHVKVYADDTLLSVGTHYSLTGVGSPAGFSVTLVNPGLIAPARWTVFVDPPVEQGADLSVGGTFGTLYENGLDAITRQMLAMDDKITRTIKVNVSSQTAGGTVTPGADDTVAVWSGNNLVEGPSVDDINGAAGSAAAAVAAKLAAEAARDDAGAYLIGVKESFLGSFANDAAADAYATAEGLTKQGGRTQYFNTTDDVTKVWTGAVWTVVGPGNMQGGNNLNDVASKPDARLNLIVPTYRATRADAKLVDPTKDKIVIVLGEGLKNGTFLLRAKADMTADELAVAALDIDEGIHLAVGANHYLIRDFPWAMIGVMAEWFDDGAADSSPWLQRLIDMAQRAGKTPSLQRDKFYQLNTGLTIKHGQSASDAMKYHARLIGNNASLAPNGTFHAISIIPRCLNADSGTGRGVAHIDVRDIEFNGYLNANGKALKLGVSGYSCDNFADSPLHNLVSNGMTGVEVFDIVECRKLKPSSIVCRGGQVRIGVYADGGFCGDFTFDGLEITGSTVVKPGLLLLAYAPTSSCDLRGIRFNGAVFYGSGYGISASGYGRVGDIWLNTAQFDVGASGEIALIIETSGANARMFGLRIISPYIANYSNAAIYVNSAVLGGIEMVYVTGSQIGLITPDTFNAVLIFSKVRQLHVLGSAFSLCVGDTNSIYVRCYGCEQFTVISTTAKDGTDMGFGVMADGASEHYGIGGVYTDATNQVSTNAATDKHVYAISGVP